MLSGGLKNEQKARNVIIIPGMLSGGLLCERRPRMLSTGLKQQQQAWYNIEKLKQQQKL